MIRSGRAIAETARVFGVSWSTVRAALNEAVAPMLADVDMLGPRMLGIDDRLRSVRFFKDMATNKRLQIEPWMTTIVDLDTRQILGVVDDRDHTGVGAWLLKRPF